MVPFLKKILNLTNNSHGLSILIILILLLGISVFYPYLTFEKLYLFKDIGSDAFNIVLPQYLHLSDYLRTEGIPKWSFNQGMGQNIYPFSLGEPFSLILFLMGREYLVFGIVYVEFLKIILGGIFFYLYLREVSFIQFTSIIGGLSFAFSGFMILGGTWYQFSVEAVYTALLLYALEKLINRGTWIFLPFPIALIAAYQPFNLFMYGLLILCYTALRLAATSDGDVKRFLKILFKIFGAGLLGVGMSSVFLFSNLLQYWESPRVTGNSSFFDKLLSSGIFTFANRAHYITAISRFFSSDLLGTGSNFKGWYNYLEAPIFYGGLLNLLLLPQAFSFAHGKKKLLLLIISFLTVIPIIFPFFRFAFWLFIGDYYRTYSFFVMLLSLFLGMYALNHILKTSRLNIPLLIITAAGLSAVIYSPFLTHTIEPVREIRFLILVMLNLYALIIYSMSRSSIRHVGLLVLLLTVCLELSSFSYITANHRPAISNNEYSQKIGYNDYTMDVVQFLRSKDTSFFRIRKSYSSSPAIHQGLNDGKAQNFYGTSSYHTFNQKHYIGFLEGLHIIESHDETQTRWAPGISEGRILLLSLVNVKYYLTKQNNPMLRKFGYVPIIRMGDVKAFENRYYLPLGITFDSFMTTDEFNNLSLLKKDITLLRACVIDPSQRSVFDGYKCLNTKDIPDTYNFGAYKTDIQRLKQDLFVINKFGQNVIKGSIDLKKKKLLFLSIPFDKGWTAIVDGKPEVIQRIDFGLMGLPLDEGFHVIRLVYEPPLLITGTICTGISFLIFLFLVRFDILKGLNNLNPFRNRRAY